MAAFPTLTCGAVVMAGSSYSVAFPATVVRFIGGQEQRWVKGQQRATDIEIVLVDISQYDISQVRAFWIAAKGAAGTSWSITIDGITYTNMAFADDNFTPVLSDSGGDLWNLTLKAMQTI
jgi:hypothetical protein